jgi:hypothetical protein
MVLAGSGAGPEALRAYQGFGLNTPAHARVIIGCRGASCTGEASGTGGGEGVASYRGKAAKGVADVTGGDRGSEGAGGDHVGNIVVAWIGDGPGDGEAIVVGEQGSIGELTASVVVRAGA